MHKVMYFMLESEIEKPNGDVWLQYHGNVWFCCGNDFFFRAMLGRFAIASLPNHAESHCMLYNWVSIFSNSLQLNLSMLTLQLVNWSSKP